MGILRKQWVRYWCGSGIFFLKDHYFFRACKKHDKNYMWRLIPRRQADKDFLKDMLKLAWDRFKYKVLAYVFYWVVRIVGGLFYYDVV